MEETFAQLLSASDHGFGEVLKGSSAYLDEENEIESGCKQARNPNNDYSMLSGPITVDAFNSGRRWDQRQPSLGDIVFSNRNLVPINLNESVQDGCMTLAAFSNDVTSLINTKGVKQTSLTGVGVTVYHLSHRDREPHFDQTQASEFGWDPFWQNCVPLLVLASLAGEYRFSEYDNNLVILTDSQPNLATSHITEVSKSGTATRRDYDTYATARTSILRLSTSVDEHCPSGTPPILVLALTIAAKLWPNSYKALVGKVKLKTAYRPSTLKGLMINAMRELPIPPGKLQLLIAEASACLGRVHGTSDEAMVERQSPVIMCVRPWTTMAPVYGHTNDKLTARDVKISMAQGIMSFDAGYTKLLNMFSVQTDPTIWQRGEQLTTLAGRGVDLSHKTNSTYDTVCIAKVLNKTGYGRATKHDYARDIEWLQAAGHYIREDKLDGAPFMKVNVQQTRDILSSDTPLGAETRAQHRRNYNSNQPYAHSLASDQAEYICNQNDACGVQMCNVLSPRSTAGALIANTLWVDSTSIILGCDRQLNVFHKGNIEGRLSRVTLQAAELKRYGYELEASDRRSCGVGNSRREYGFFSNEQIAVSFKISRVTKMLGKLTAKSDLRARIGADNVIDEADLSWFSATRANTDLVMINGIHSNVPEIYKKAGDPMHSAIYSFSTFDVKYDLRRGELGLPVTSSASRATVSIPGGLSVKRLAYESPARLIPNEEGTMYAINGDLARSGVDAYGAILMKQVYGIYFGKAMESELFEMLLDRQILDIEHKWRADAYALLAAEIYQSKLGTWAKRTIERLVWHACTGYVIVSLKTMIASHEAISENVKPLQVAIAVYETSHFTGQMLFTALNLVYHDLGWDDCVGKAHLMTLAISERGVDWCLNNSTQLSRCLSADVGLPLNETCPKSGRCCRISCFVEGSNKHMCYSCNRSVECTMCDYNLGLLDGADPIERCVASNEKNRTLNDGIDDQKYVTEIDQKDQNDNHDHRLVIKLAHIRCCNGSGKVFTANERTALASRHDDTIGLSQAIDMMFNPDTPIRESAELVTYTYDSDSYAVEGDHHKSESGGSDAADADEVGKVDEQNERESAQRTLPGTMTDQKSSSGMTIKQLLDKQFGQQGAWDHESSDEDDEYATANETTPRSSTMVLGRLKHPERTSSLAVKLTLAVTDKPSAAGDVRHEITTQADDCRETNEVTTNESSGSDTDATRECMQGESSTVECPRQPQIADAVRLGRLSGDCSIKHVCRTSHKVKWPPSANSNGDPIATDAIKPLPDCARLLSTVSQVTSTDCLTLGCACAGCVSARDEEHFDRGELSTFTGGCALWHHDPLEIGGLDVNIDEGQPVCWGPKLYTLLNPYSSLWPYCWLASVLGVHAEDIPFDYASDMWREGLMEMCPERYTRQNYVGKSCAPADINIPMIIKNLAHGTLCGNKMRQTHENRLIRRGTHYIYSFKFLPCRENVLIDYRAVEHFTQMIPWIHDSLVASDNQESIRVACSGAHTGDWNHYEISINPLDEHEALVIKVECLSTCLPTRKHVTKLPRIKQSPKMIDILCNLWTENMRKVLEDPELDY
nr:MAG: uncharacterised protein [Cordyceps militaris quadrivirus 1]